MDEREATRDQVPGEEAGEGETGVPPEASFAQRGTFEGAYGEGSAEAWQDEQAAQRADHPNPPRSSGMGGSDTAYSPDTGFAPDSPPPPPTKLSEPGFTPVHGVKLNDILLVFLGDELRLAPCG